MQNLKIIAQTGAEKSVTEYFVKEKENLTNKGTDKPCVPVDSLTHSTTRQSNVKILGQVVPEKSIFGGEKVYKQTQRHTNIVTEKAKAIYPYIHRLPGVLYGNI